MTLGGPRERPTATLEPRDVSETLGRASAVPEGRGSLSEEVLIVAGLGLGRVQRTALGERCACGGWIVAEDEYAVSESVLLHVRSTHHHRWAIATGLR
jgi:hypothetical protein